MIKRTLCFSNPAYLSLKNGQLVIKLPQVEKNDDLPDNFKANATKTIPIEDIAVVVLDDKQITITQGLMGALLDNNCAIITCDNRHLPTGLLLPLKGNTLQSERFQDQIEASLPLKKQLWQQTVQAKIHNQASVLKRLRETEIGNMLSIPVLDVVINGQRNPLMIAATQTTASLYKCFSGELRKIIYPVMEL